MAVSRISSLSVGATDYKPPVHRQCREASGGNSDIAVPRVAAFGDTEFATQYELRTVYITSGGY